MLGLIALTAIAVIAGLALRRVRDRVLTGLAVAGLVLLAIPALLIEGDAVEKLIAALYIYAPFWEYLLPVAFFAMALLPKNRKTRRARREKRRENFVVTV